MEVAVHESIPQSGKESKKKNMEKTLLKKEGSYEAIKRKYSEESAHILEHVKRQKTMNDWRGKMDGKGIERKKSCIKLTK